MSQRDAQIAQELTRKQQVIRQDSNDAQYIAKRDEAFAKNLQRIEREYRERQRMESPALSHSRQMSESSQHSRVPPTHARDDMLPPTHARDEILPPTHARDDMSYHDMGGGIRYDDDKYLVQVARPALVTDEPLYMNNVRDTGTPDSTLLPPTHSTLLPPTPFRGESQRGEPSKFPDIHNVSSEFSGGRSSQSSIRSRSSLASTTPSEVLGAVGGAPPASLTPTDVQLGIGAALSPAELRAAEAAERLLEQERRDMEIARQLQVNIDLSN